MSTAVVCNTLVSRSGRSCSGLFVDLRDHYCQDTPAEISVRSVGFREWTASQRQSCRFLMKSLAIRLLIRFRTRFASSVRKLKIPAGCPVPFCNCDVVLINRFEQSALGLQKSGLTHAVLKRRDQTGCNIFPNSAGTFLRSGRRGCERFLAGSGCLNVVGDPRELPADVRFQFPTCQFVLLPRCSCPQHCPSDFSVIDHSPRVCCPFLNLRSNEILCLACR